MLIGRINVVLDPETEKNLVELTTMTSKKKAGVVKTAIKLLHMVLDCQRRGGSIIIKEPDGSTRELYIL